MTDRILLKPEQYASCPYDEKILDFYKGQFSDVFILLHPFISPKKIDLERFCPEKWPSKKEIIEGCEAVSWAKVLELTELKKLSQIDVGLRTSISSLKKEIANETYASCLNDLTKKYGIIHPSEGDLPPLVENRIYNAIKSLGHEWLWVGDEHGTERKLCWIDDLIANDEVPSHGCVFTHDHSLLVTTHWDSHCSYFCSSKSIIESVLAIEKFEGFYCSKNTEVYWGVHEI